MAVAPPSVPAAALARQAREQFVTEVGATFPALAEAIHQRLSALADQVSTAHTMQERRDALLAYNKSGQRWLEGAQQAWAKTTERAKKPAAHDIPPTELLSLVEDQEVEDRILASRLVQAITDKCSWELNDLRLRIQSLQGGAEMDGRDPFHPEVLTRLLVQEWSASGLDRVAWALVNDVVRHHLADQLLDAYHHANEFLVRSGVMPEIDLKPQVRRSKGGGSSLHGAADSGGASTGGATLHDSGGHTGSGASGHAGSGRAGGGRAGAQPGADSQAGEVYAGSGAAGSTTRIGASRLADETRMLTGSTPLARMRMRAQGVVGQLKRLLNDKVAGYEMTRPANPSPALAQAMSEFEATELASYEGVGAVSYDTVEVVQVAQQVRERSARLKEKASTDSEKATIEIVALMFQSILAEERIPAGARVWFANKKKSTK